jgi:hypothetical protein
MRVFGLFAKRPVPGQVKTRLAADVGPVNAATLYEAFLHDLLDRFRDAGDRRMIGYTPDHPDTRAYFAGLPADLVPKTESANLNPRKPTGDIPSVIACDLSKIAPTGLGYHLWPQPSGPLDVRIEAFFDEALSQGPPQTVRAVLIGSDSPTLPCDYIEQAFQALEHRDVVLGPATDGGYYLIGVRRQVPGWLRAVPWSTNETLRRTVEAATAMSASLALLPPWYDVDTPEDLAFLASHFAALRAAEPDRPVSRTEAWLTAAGR